MRSRILGFALAGLALLPAGCAASFRAGGNQHAIGAGAAIGPAPQPVVVPVTPPEGGYTVPPP